MAYFKKTKTNLFKQILFSRGMALAIICAIVFVGYGLVSIISKSVQASNDRKVAEAQAASLQQQETALNAKIAALNTPDGQEAALREEFPVVKPGEHVVVITGGDSSDSGTSQTAAAASAPASNGFWSFLKGLFK